MYKYFNKNFKFDRCKACNCIAALKAVLETYLNLSIKMRIKYTLQVKIIFYKRKTNIENKKLEKQLLHLIAYKNKFAFLLTFIH